MVDLLVYTNHRRGDMYYNKNTDTDDGAINDIYLEDTTPEILAHLNQQEQTIKRLRTRRPSSLMSKNIVLLYPYRFFLVVCLFL